MKLNRLIQASCIAALGLTISHANSQVASHPDAKSPLPANPYLKHADAWRWDIHSQIFVRSAVETRRGRIQNAEEEAKYERSSRWALEDLEVVFPVVREGGFYWSPNKEVDVSIRVDDRVLDPERKQMYTKGTHAEYTLWRSDIKDWVSAIQMIHDSHIVVADTVFDEKKARQLPWPDSWSPEVAGYLSPVVDSVGKDVNKDAAETVKTLLDFWVDNGDPKQLPEVDLVKFLSGKVIEHVQVRKPPAEHTTRNTGRNIGTNFAFIGGLSMGGFIVRPADEIARDSYGSKHDLAVLLTSVLRSAGVPARTVICIDMGEDPTLEQFVSMVEFAMYDPDRKLTFWVPIDIDRLRLNGKRANQYKQPWLYFGTHDELNEYVPLAYYFHPPASYRAYDLPALFGLRSKSELPEYAVQGLLVDPMVTPITANELNPSKNKHD